MSDYGEYTQVGTIRFERLLPGPIERIWTYLTDAERRSEWLAGGPMELHEGGSVRLVFDHDRLTPHEDPVPDKYREHAGETVMEGTVVEVDPPHRLTFTWGEDSGSDSVVTFELAPQDNEVLLTLTHRRLGDDSDLLVGVGAGWHTHLGILADKLKNHVPEPFWAVYAELEQTYAGRLDRAHVDD